jgi:hypothetical protein
MNVRILVAALALALALAQGAVIAAEPIKAVARPVAADGTVEISNVRGSIKVSGWERHAVAVTGSLGEGTRLVFEGEGNRVIVRAQRISEGKGWFGWGGSGPKEDTRLEVFVPFGASLEIEGVSADTRVDGIRDAASIEAESVSGDVEVNASTTRLDVSSVSGDVSFTGRARRVHAESVSGDLRFSGIDGEFGVDTVSGRVGVTASRLSQLKAGTVSGDLDFDVDLIGNASVGVEAMSGEVTLTLPASLSATVNAESFSGSLHADFPVTIVDNKGPGSEMHGKVGGGDARIELESFSGDIRLRRR